MAVKKCVKCGSSWSSLLLKCAFCGGDGISEQAPEKVTLPGEGGSAPIKAEAAVVTATVPAAPPVAPKLDQLTPLPPSGP